MLGVGGFFVADAIVNTDGDNVTGHDLIVSVNPPGSGSVNPGGDLYDSGIPVLLTATASTGYQFYKWSGDASGISPTITVTMDSDKNVTAYFIPEGDVTLSTLVSPDRSGTITRNPDKDKYEDGTKVILTAIPASGHHFVSWSGDLGSNTNPITIIMNGNKIVTASFAINTYTTTASAGSGGSINPSGQVTVKYGANQSFSITPDTGYHIHKILVDGASIDMVSNYTFTNVTADHSIVASFTQKNLTLSVNINGNGSVTKNPDQLTYSYGDLVTLTAIPISGYRFDNWSGDASDTSLTTTLIMDRDRNVIANFIKLYQRIEYTMPVDLIGGSEVIYSKALKAGDKVDGFVQLAGQYHSTDWSYEWTFQIIGPAGESIHLWKGHWVNNNYHEFSFTASYAGTYKIRVYHVSSYSKNLTIEIRPPGWY